MRLLLALLCASTLAAPAAAQRDTLVSLPTETGSTALTVYNGGFAVVREERPLRLAPGRNAVRYEGVAQRIDPTSVSFLSLTDPGGVVVREQNYRYDLVSPRAVLEKAVGKRVRFRQPNGAGGWNVIEGTLLSAPSSGGVVVRTDDGRIVLDPAGAAEVDELGEGLISRPSLLWLLDAGRGGRHRARVSYTTEGIGWSADYVAVLSEDESEVDLTGWVTLDNRSGATYRDAALQLMAGDVRREQRGRFADQVSVEALTVMAAPPPPSFGEEAFFEYHLYTLDGTTTIADNETKQMTLLSAPQVDVSRRLVFDPAGIWWRWRSRRPGQAGATAGIPAAIVMELRNSAADGMGMPLPAGRVRVYKADRSGALQFVGEDRIDHTPRDERVLLYVGDAFDVVGERKVVDSRSGSRPGCSYSQTISYSLRNHKEAAAEVLLVEHPGCEWRVAESTHRHRRIDARTFEIPVRLAAGEELTVTYTIVAP